MIARIWTGVVTQDRLVEYAAYVDSTGVGAYRQTPGNQAAYILTRHLNDGTAELLAFSLWNDVDAIRRFAGDDINAMVLYPADHDYLLTTPTLDHYRVLQPPLPADQDPAMSDHPLSSHIRDVATAFSSHRFRDTYDHLAPDVIWIAVGGSTTHGKEGVVTTCEDTLAELADTTTEFTRILSVADDTTAAVDVVGRYTAPDGGISTVASCDIYEFRDHQISRITSYTVELDNASEQPTEHRTWGGDMSGHKRTGSRATPLATHPRPPVQPDNFGQERTAYARPDLVVLPHLDCGGSGVCNGNGVSGGLHQ